MHARSSLFIVPLMVAALLGGCATTTKSDESATPKLSLETALAEAATAQKAGHPDQAVLLLKGAATHYPADKSPWLRIAQIKFDMANYGEAIMNALEALQRDPSDNAANSIVTVSGLRLATKSLSDLRTQNALSGSVKTEAQDLAKLLRENLGEAVLVPPGPKVAEHVVRRPRPPGIVKVEKTGVAPAKGAAPASPEGDGKPSSNPFGGLK